MTVQTNQTKELLSSSKLINTNGNKAKGVAFDKDFQKMFGSMVRNDETAESTKRADENKRTDADSQSSSTNSSDWTASQLVSNSAFKPNAIDTKVNIEANAESRKISPGTQARQEPQRSKESSTATNTESKSDSSNKTAQGEGTDSQDFDKSMAKEAGADQGDVADTQTSTSDSSSSKAATPAADGSETIDTQFKLADAAKLSTTPNAIASQLESAAATTGSSKTATTAVGKTSVDNVTLNDAKSVPSPAKLSAIDVSDQKIVPVQEPSKSESIGATVDTSKVIPAVSPADVNAKATDTISTAATAQTFAKIDMTAISAESLSAKDNGIEGVGTSNGVNNNTPSNAIGVLGQSTSASSTSTVKVNAPLGSNTFPAEMSQKIVWMVGRQMSQADIRINPETLGPINLKIQMRGNEAQITVTAQDPQAQQLLAQAIPALKEILSQSGIDLSQAQVQVAGGNVDSNQQGSGNARQQQQGAEPQFRQLLNNGGDAEPSVDAISTLPPVRSDSNSGVDTFA
jgi:flagellar hook-length control protein FliK